MPLSLLFPLTMKVMRFKFATGAWRWNTWGNAYPNSCGVCGWHPFHGGSFHQRLPVPQDQEAVPPCASTNNHAGDPLAFVVKQPPTQSIWADADNCLCCMQSQCEVDLSSPLSRMIAFLKGYEQGKRPPKAEAVALLDLIIAKSEQLAAPMLLEQVEQHPELDSNGII
eukprot:scaffold262455_cov45-Prasinocladus_malaysianus.AAC.2